MDTNALTFDSPFAVNLQAHLWDQFVSLTVPEGAVHTVAMPVNQVSAETLTQLAAQPFQGGVNGAALDVTLDGSLDGSVAIAPVGLSQTILAQQFEETDLGKQVQDAWGNFVESGQIWALCIGVLFGYMFRTFTGG